jgi:integrating conjugative element protein (TIGR03757 family)
MFTCSDEPRHRRLTLCSIFMLCTLASANVMAADIRVFTDRNHPVKAPVGVRVVELDAPARIEAELAASLPADPARAATIIQQRLKDGGPELQQRMAAAYQGVTDAWSMGITKIPAVIVDLRYVVYGEPDVARALTRIADYRRTER